MIIFVDVFVVKFYSLLLIFWGGFVFGFIFKLSIISKPNSLINTRVNNEINFPT